MAVRMLVYVGLLLQELIRTQRLKASDRLPPILPIVLYNGKRPWRAPRDLLSLFAAVPDGLRRRLPRLEYVLVDESRLSREDREQAGNLVAALARLETSLDARELSHSTRELALLLPRGEQSDLRRIFTAWALQVLRRTHRGATIPEVEDLEEVPMLEERIRDWERKARREGRKEGLVEGARRMVLRQMERRFRVLCHGVSPGARSTPSPRFRSWNDVADKVLVGRLSSRIWGSVELPKASSTTSPARGSALVAYSGGVDSAVVAALAFTGARRPRAGGDGGGGDARRGGARPCAPRGGRDRHPPRGGHLQRAGRSGVRRQSEPPLLRLPGDADGHHGPAGGRARLRRGLRRHQRLRPGTGPAGAPRRARARRLLAPAGARGDQGGDPRHRPLLRPLGLGPAGQRLPLLAHPARTGGHARQAPPHRGRRGGAGRGRLPRRPRAARPGRGPRRGRPRRGAAPHRDLERPRAAPALPRLRAGRLRSSRVPPGRRGSRLRESRSAQAASWRRSPPASALPRRPCATWRSSPTPTSASPSSTSTASCATAFPKRSTPRGSGRRICRRSRSG